MINRSDMKVGSFILRNIYCELVQQKYQRLFQIISFDSEQTIAKCQVIHDSSRYFKQNEHIWMSVGYLIATDATIITREEAVEMLLAI